MSHVSKRRKAAAYRDTAAFLNEKNWCQSTIHLSSNSNPFYYGDDKFCAVGAMNMVTFSVPWACSSEVGSQPFRDREAERQVLRRRGGVFGALVTFNDRPSTTVKDVQKALRRIARHLEHGGGGGK